MDLKIIPQRFQLSEESFNIEFWHETRRKIAVAVADFFCKF